LRKRPFGLIAIVCYKSFIAALMMVTSIAILLAAKNYQGLDDFSDDYVLEGNGIIIEWLTEKVLNSGRKTLAFSGIGAAIYSGVTAIEAIGLWYEKRWAHILVVGLVSFSIIPEIYELFRGVTPIKLVLFLVNITMLWYLIRNFPKNSH
jgi:uncharacterized membrane protein (DUF2068 family)